MEIVTYVRTGAITHQDSLGNKGRTGGRRRPGDERRHRRHPRRVQSRGRRRRPCSRSGSRPTGPAPPPSWGAMPFPKDARDGTIPAAGERRCRGWRADHQRRRADSRRDRSRPARRSSSTPTRRATSIWSRAAGCASTGEALTPRDGVAITGEEQDRDRGRGGRRAGPGRFALSLFLAPFIALMLEVQRLGGHGPAAP